MGKSLMQQAKGKGGPRYRTPSFRFEGDTAYRAVTATTVSARVEDIVKCQGHLAPLMKLHYTDGVDALIQAPEGVKVGDVLMHGADAPKDIAGSILNLSEIPDGALVFNIEAQPGDGGKFCRTSGTFAKVVGKENGKVVLLLPSKKNHYFNPTCRATIGIVAGAGRTDKPFLKAGAKHFHMTARNKRWPVCRAAAQNAVDHPYGNKRTSRKGKNKPVGHDAPPGRKVGTLWPRRTGRQK